jgi:hypothetical protein
VQIIVRLAFVLGLSSALACTVGDPGSDAPCPPWRSCFPSDDSADDSPVTWDPAEESSSGGDDDEDTGGMPDDDDPSPPEASGLPCDVRDALARACGDCHGEQPSFGAPMPLVTYADLQVPSPTDPTKKVYEVVATRIDTTSQPMPPDGDITDAERTILLDWIAAGAPEDTTADCDDIEDEDVDPVGPDALPCEPTFEVRAHAPGAVDQPFVVPQQGAEDLYQCFSFQAPFASPTQAIAWAPIIDDERVIHHWILYRTQQPQEEGGVFPCDVGLQLSADFIAGWAPGGENVIMPPSVGLELGSPGDWYILQVHYHNAAMYPDALDRSGVAFCTPDQPEPQTAGVLTLGTTGLSIPAGAMGHEEVGNCGGLATFFWPQMHIIGSSPHMHELGRHMKTIVTHGDGSIETVIDKPFNFEQQGMYFNDQEIIAGPGDTLTTTCTYDNDTGAHVGFGEGTGDEMCFNFVLAYPIDELGNRNCGIVF